MIIDLNKLSDTCEYFKVSVSKNSEKISYVQMDISRDALVGFAKNLIWMYEDIDKNKQFYICADPLGGEVSGCEINGFFLAKNSPILVFRVNYPNNNLKGTYRRLYSKIDIDGETKIVEVKRPLHYSIPEDYELNDSNLARITLYDAENKDITNQYYEVFFDLSYEGIKNMAIVLLRLLDAYQENIEYIFKYSEFIDDCEIVLTDDSLPFKIKCCDLGYISDYEPRPGKR